jgi:tight adherence protein B
MTGHPEVAGPLACVLLGVAVLLWPGSGRAVTRRSRSGLATFPLRQRGPGSLSLPGAGARASPPSGLFAHGLPGVAPAASGPRRAELSRWLIRLRRGGRGDGDDRALAVVEALAIQVRAGASPEAAWRHALDVIAASPATRRTQAGSLSTAGSVPGGSPRKGLSRGQTVPGGGSSAESSSGDWLRGRFSAGGTPADLPANGAVGQGPAWRALAAAWRLSEQTGAPLADVLDRLAVGLRQEAEVEAEVEAALAAPRATARLLAGLPLVGVALGELIGAHPVAVLVETPLGRGCALGGLVLAGAGHLWTRALVARVVRTAGAG